VTAIKSLYELQEVDMRLAATEKSLAEVRARLADNSAVDTARNRLARVQTALDQHSAHRRALEREAEVFNDKLKGLDAKLYGGTVTNPRELEALEKEKAFTKGQQKENDNQLLEAMVALEEGQADKEKLTGDLVRLQAERAASMVELKAEEEGLAGELAELGQERTAKSADIPPVDMARYESLRKSRGGQAIAKVVGGVCQGCRVALPSGELQRVKSGQGVIQCSSCRRLLFVA
jgi:predicted  nucleic acid-binding Zn-ribbon protein